MVSRGLLKNVFVFMDDAFVHGFNILSPKFGEFEKEGFLIFGKMFGCFDLNLDEQVAFPTAGEVLDSLPLQTDDFSGLNPGSTC